MPLDKQNIPLPIDTGMDTKSDSKQAVKMALVQNGTYQNPGKVGKRQGNAALGTTVYGSGPALASGSSLAVASRGQELVQVNGKNVYSYSAALSKWVQKGQAYGVKYARRSTPSSTSGVFLRSDLAVSGSVALQVVEYARVVSGTPTLYASVYDLATGASFVSDYILMPFATSSTAAFPIALSTAGNLYAFFAESGGSRLWGTFFNASNPTSVTGPVLLASDCTQDSMDVVVLGSNIFLAYHQGANLKILKLDASLNVVTSQTVALAATSPAVSAISLCADATNSLIYALCSYVDSGTNKLAYSVFTSALAVSTTTTQLTTSTLWRQIITLMRGSNCEFLLSNGFPAINAAYVGNLVHSGSVSGASVIQQPTLLASNFSLVSKPFAVTGTLSGTYIQTGVFDPYNAQLITMEWPSLNSLSVAGRSYFGEMGSMQGGASYMPTVSVSGSTVYFASSILESLTLALNATLGLNNSGPTYSNAPALITSTFGDTATCLSMTTPDSNLTIGAGVLLSYDGNLVFESNFLMAPEINNPTDIGSGSQAAGKYEYVAVLRFTDANGQVHRSQPSSPLAYTVTGGTSKIRFDLRAYSLPSAIGKQARLDIYRTTANGSVLFKCTNDDAGVNPLLQNDPTAMWVTFTDGQADTQITTNEILYTSGGVLGNDEVGSVIASETHKGRLFLLTEETNRVHYSKIRLSGEAINFNLQEYLESESSGGANSSLKSLDDKLVLFKPEKVYAIYGDGPDDTGQNGQYSDPQPLTSPVGCPYPKSLVSIPDGVIFKSLSQGFWLLDRGLNLSYIGAEVEAYNSANVTSAVRVGNTTQVRFTLDSGNVLTYDYYSKKWAVASGISAVSACMWNGVYTWVDANGVVYQEGGVSDNGTAISLLLQTQWIHLAGLQGFQRIYRALFLGTYYSGHTLTIQVDYDYEGTWSETHAFTPDGVSTYQFGIQPARQKCEAIRFKIFDTATGSPGQGYDLSGIELVIGKKQGAMKLPASRKG